MQYPIVVFNQYAAAAAHALNNPNHRSKSPLAAAFLKHLYGTVRPTIRQLDSLAVGGLTRSECYTRRELIISGLERLLSSHGDDVPPSLGEYLVNLCFPYRHHRYQQRVDHRLSMRLAVNSKVSQKKHEEALSLFYALVLDTTLGQLVDSSYEWVAEYGESIVRVGLHRYWNHHDQSKYSFDELYPRELDWPVWKIATAITNDIQITN